MSPDVNPTVEKESRRTNPDYIVYVPQAWDGSCGDSLNEHFLAFDGPDGSLMAVWTQSALAGGVPGERQFNHIVFSRSTNEGVDWQPPLRIAGPGVDHRQTKMSSWAFPLVADSGRVYVVYNQSQGVSGWIAMHTGTMAAVYSDDAGKTWSQPQDVPMPKSPFDDPAGKVPPEWIVWQKPMRDLEGSYLVGYSHWLHPDVATLGRDEIKGWTWIESVVEFMRFTNVHVNPEPRDLTIEYHSWGEKALRVSHYIHPLCSVAQEPSIVRLPDDRLFCVMRTCSGYIWWSQSGDDGRSWCSPRPLLDQDFGRPLLNSVGCDPIYQLSDGRYILVYHNHRGFTDESPASESRPRNPLYLVLGEFRPRADQPVWFSPPKLFMDTDDRWVDGKKHGSDDPRNTTLSMYSSLTSRGGVDVLWYPERKFFLLGRNITSGLLADLEVSD